MSNPTEGVKLEPVCWIGIHSIEKLKRFPWAGADVWGERHSFALNPLYGPEAAKRIEELEAQLVQAKALVTEANNSLFGSQGYFHSLNGGPFDKHHLSSAIEDLKARALKAESLRDELVGALKPYAAILTEDEDGLPDDTRVTVSFGPTTNYSLTLTDFRRAWDVLSKAQEPS